MTKFVHYNTGQVRGTKAVTEFAGVLCYTRLSAPLPMELVVTTRQRRGLKWALKLFDTATRRQRIMTNDRGFDSRFDVYCASGTFANSVLSEAGRVRVMLMRDHPLCKDFKIAAQDDRAYMLIPSRRNFFEMPPLNRPFNEAQDGARLQQEVENFLSMAKEMRALFSEVG